MSVAQHIRDRAGRFRWMGLLVVWAVFIAMAAVLLVERAFKTGPSAQNLNEYCDFLGEYLGSGLAEGRVAQIQRQQYARLLARRCEREDTFELRIRFATALARSTRRRP